MNKCFIIIYIILIGICSLLHKESYIPLVILFISYAILSEESTIEVCNVKLKEIIISLFLIFSFYVLLHLKCNEYISLFIIVIFLLIYNNYLKIKK